MPRLRILIMEDDETLARAMRNHLQHERYDVTLGPDGQEGIRLARNISPDCVIVDFNIRVVDALAVCRQLRGEEFTRKIPILLLGKKEELSAPVVAAAGADDQLARPFSMKDLI
jgi:DNA-binding response OmpR family regulator